MTSTILVTGAPGNVGAEVVKGLQGKAAFRVGALSVDRARAALGDQNEYVTFNFLDPATFPDAFNGIQKLFLVRPPQLGNVPKEIAPAINAAIEAGVKHIVFLSLQGVEQQRIVPHYKIEQLIRASGISYTFLRAGFFMQNLSTTHRAEIRDYNEIRLPVGKAKTSFIDVRDIAAVGVCALTEDGHENKVYTLTGSEALDYYEVASILTDVLRRTIRYTNPSALRFVVQQVRAGQPFKFALLMAALYTITRFGNAKEIAPDVQQVLGRPPILFKQFAADYRAEWTPV